MFVTRTKTLHILWFVNTRIFSCIHISNINTYYLIYNTNIIYKYYIYIIYIIIVYVLYSNRKNIKLLNQKTNGITVYTKVVQQKGGHPLQK